MMATTSRIVLVLALLLLELAATHAPAVVALGSWLSGHADTHEPSTAWYKRHLSVAAAVEPHSVASLGARHVSLHCAWHGPHTLSTLGASSAVHSATHAPPREKARHALHCVGAPPVQLKAHWALHGAQVWVVALR
jgi:hypothetical protein